MSLTDAAARNARPREKSYVASFPVGLYGALIVALCAEEIAEKRLRALPFAVRCKDCEEAREVAQKRRQLASRRSGSALFLDM